MGFILVLYMVCHLHVFDVIAILKKGSKGDVCGKVVADQV